MSIKEYRWENNGFGVLKPSMSTRGWDGKKETWKSILRGAPGAVTKCDEELH